nr:Ig-like domain-containing protein [Leifsonia naganoensis]
MGASAFANLTVREDDGVTGAAPALAPVGAQGDVCAELAAATNPVPLETSAEDVAPGDSFTLRATGYRAGETVAFRYGATDLGTAVVDADGTASVVVPVAEDADLGPADATATGSGSGRAATVSVSVLAPTATTVTVSPATPTAGQKVTFTATVTGRDTAGTVAFLDGGEPAAAPTATASALVAVAAPTVLGEVEVVDGVATLTLPGGLAAGNHAITASFARTATASASTSDPIAVTVAPAASTGGSETGGAGSTGSGSGTGSAAAGASALAETGSAIGLWLLAGVTVLLAGAGLLAASRRRRIAE